MAVKDDRHAHLYSNYTAEPDATRPSLHFGLPRLPGHPSHSRVVGQQPIVTNVGRCLHVRSRGQFKEWQISILVRVSLVPVDR